MAVMALPKIPGTLRRALGVAAILGAAVLVLDLLAPKGMWDGGKAGRLDVVVTDAATGQPLAGAAVTYHWPNADPGGTMDPAYLGRPLRAGTTDAGGACRLVVMFGAGGTFGLFGRSGAFMTDNELRVEAKGYRTFDEPLADLVGGRSHRLGASGSFGIPVKLVAAPAKLKRPLLTSPRPSTRAAGGGGV